MATPPPPGWPLRSPPREGFALSGPSVTLDPLTHAVRPDLADVRLAAYVFAPHYAEPLTRLVDAVATLRAARDSKSEALATLAPGDAFEVLEFAGSLAWGIAPAEKLVGYLPTAALTVAR